MLEASFASTHQGVKNYMYHYHLALAHQCKLKKYIVKNRNSPDHKNFKATYTELLQVTTVHVIGLKKSLYLNCNYAIMLHFDDAILPHLTSCGFSVGIDYRRLYY